MPTALWQGAPRLASLLALAAAVATLAACATPQAPESRQVFDFGPGSFEVATSALAAKPAARAPLVLPEIDAPAALDGTPMLYRLNYADSQQLRPYAQARWSMAPAQLVRARLREALGQRGPVLSVGDAATDTPRVLRLELEEFGQLFESPTASSGALRLRATLTQRDKFVAQRVFSAQKPAASQDAAGGAKALAGATDALTQEISAWLDQVAK